MSTVLDSRPGILAGRPLGPRGLPPEHQWSGPNLSFRNPDGTWGDPENLLGPVGPNGDDQVYSTVAQAQSASVPAGLNRITVASYAAGNRDADVHYARVSSEPLNGGSLRTTDRYLPDGSTDSSDGGWWEICDLTLHQYGFGAAGNGTTDDTTAIKAMVAFAESKGVQIKALPGLHKITDTIALLKSADLSACVFFAEATVVSPVVRAGVTSGAGAFSETFRLPKVVNASKYNVDATKLIGFTKSTTGWTGFDDKIGVEAGTCNNCYIYLEDIYGFGVGFTGGGYNGDGFAYNSVFPKYLLNNKANFRLKPGNDSGWANENTTYGGRYDFDTDEGTGVGNSYDIFLTADVTCENVPNNNVFIHPSVESNTPDYCIWFLGKYNKVINPRFDGAKKFVGIYSRTAGESSYNEIQGGYGTISSTTLGIDFYGERSYGNAIIGAGFANFEGATYQPGIALTNIAGDGANYPHIVGYPTGATTIDKRDFSTTEGVKYVYNLQAQALTGKRAADTGGRVLLDWYNGQIKAGDGAGNYAAFAYSSPGAFTSDADIYPTTDNAKQLGWSSGRWSAVYAANGTIQTSDAREKDWRGDLNAAESRVAKRLSKLVGIYRWKKDVAEQGDGALLRIGVTVQDVKAAFEAEGLDGFKYDIIKLDTWDARPETLDQDDNILMPAVEAGDRYSMNYDQLWAFVAAGFEARLTVLESG